MRVINDEKIPIKLWLEEIEDEALKQARNLANLERAFHHIAIMPDAHVGYGMPIGGVLATDGIIIPNAVGVDIGCGMIAVKTTAQNIDQASLKKILGKLRKIIPTGFTHHKKAQPWEGFNTAPDIPIIQEELNSARKQIGTLGGGNHFLEVLEEVSNKKNIWLMLHSGSRNFGKKVADVYHKKARAICEEKKIRLPDRDLAFLEFDSRVGQEYFCAMEYCLEFARANRELMMKRFMTIVKEVIICDFINFYQEHNPSSNKKEVTVTIHHNYAAQETHYGKEVIVHRKGATQALLGQLGIVPGSMGTPSYIVEGLGNPESFMSSAHGAGRQMSRKQANKQLTEKGAEEAIKGVIFGRWHGKYDEAPQAYKDIEKVIKAQSDLAKPIVKLRPLMVMIGN